MNLPTFVTTEKSVGKTIKSFHRSLFKNYFFIKFEDDTVLCLYSNLLYEGNTEIEEIIENPKVDLDFASDLRHAKLISENCFIEIQQEYHSKSEEREKKRRYQRYQELKQEFESNDG